MKQAVEVNLSALIAIGIVTIFLTLLFIKPAFKYLRPILRRLGRISFKNGFRPFSPNWITVQGLVITFIGFAAYLVWNPWWGIAIGAFGATLDRLDGKMARALDRTLSKPNDENWPVKDGIVEAKVTKANGDPADPFKIKDPTKRLQLFWQEFNFAGGTNLGEVLDPFADKLKSVAILVYLGWLTDILSPWLVGLIIAPEVLGTLMRRPFTFLRKWLYNEKATIIGKLKALTQWLVVVLCLPFDMGYCGEGRLCRYLSLVPNAILAMAVLFAVFSVVTKLAAAQKYWWVRHVQNWLGNVADHE